MDIFSQSKMDIPPHSPADPGGEGWGRNEKDQGVSLVLFRVTVP